MRSRRVLLLLPGLLGASARRPSDAAEAAKTTSAAELRGLCSLLSRADRKGSGAGTGASPETLLFETLAVARSSDDWPSAAVCALADGAVRQSEAWIRADPVHLEAGTSDLRLADPRTLDITRRESLELCGAINEALNGVPGRIEALAPSRWYIGLGAAPRLTTREPSLAVGGPVAETLPRGVDAAIWLRTLTEIQMLLHDLPLNRARAERGQPAINSVWLWGAGSLPPRPDSGSGVRLWSDAVLARGFSRLLGLPYRPLPAGFGTLLQEGGDGSLDLVFCDALHYAARLHDWPAWLEGLRRWEAEWFEPLRRALWSGKIASLRIVSDGGRWHEVSASAKWQWWRRPGALATHVAKTGATPDAGLVVASPPGRVGPVAKREPDRHRRRGGPGGNP